VSFRDTLICSVQGCPESYYAKDLCRPHYLRLHRTGTTGEVAVRQGKSGDRNPKWRGGKSSHPLYFVYHDMLSRCYTSTHHAYDRYGGRGITVCDRWREDFWNYADDIGEKPGAGYSLDRKDNDGPYSPENVEWATASEQMKNRRTSGWENRIRNDQGRFV